MRNNNSLFYSLLYCLIFVVCSLILSNCKQNTDLSSAGLPASISLSNTGNPDNFLEVDCLLPGQIRKLGSMVYASPRRPTKTTAGDCEIRGGEYVVFDRSNYRDALAIWMIEAENGDAIAETYVGEIYLKSPPNAPRYDLAMKWFTKAANHGHKRAQVNLAYLYENGLGVKTDKKKALYWYGKASGTNIENVVQQYQLSFSERTKLDKLTAENNTQLKELTRLKEEKKQTDTTLARAEKMLAQQNSAINKQLNEITLGQNEKQRLEKQLNVQKATLSLEVQNKLSELGQEIDLKETDLLKQKIISQQLLAQMSEKKNETARLETSLAAITKQFTDLNQDKQRNLNNAEKIKQLNTEKMDVEAALLVAQGILEEKNSSLGNQKTLIEQHQKEMAQLKQKMAGQNVEKYHRLEEKLGEVTKELQSKELLLVDQKRIKDSFDQQVAIQNKQVLQFQQTVAALTSKLENLPGPKIEIVDPQLLRTRGIIIAPINQSEKLRAVNGKIWAPAGLQYLTVNGEKTSVNTNGKFKAVFPVADNNVLVDIVAVDQNGNRDHMKFSLQPQSLREASVQKKAAGNSITPSSIKFGKYYALVIGNNNYRMLPQLQTAMEDARVVSQLLEKEYGFNVQLLLNANRNSILSAMNDYRKQLTENDNLLIYYAGHGTLEERNTQGFWLPVDADLDSDVNWIPTDRITGIMNLMSAKQIMVVADACYSGIMTRASLTRLDSGKSQEAYGKWLKKMAAYKSRVIISSGETKPVLDGGGGKHSVFARALIDTLKANEKILLGIDLHRAIAEKVVDVSGRLGLDQVPQYAGLNRAGHELGDFLFVPQGNGG